MSNPDPVRLVLGVTGSIAAYKAAELARLFVRHGFSVTVAMTPSAERFVTPLTFHALSGRRPYSNLWSMDDDGIAHVEHGYDADAMVVAPASANAIARIAAGFADDPVTTLALTTRAPLLFAPAMETAMWTAPATQDNLQTLQRRGATVVGPNAGDLASGRSGLGRMAEPDEILRATIALLSEKRGTWKNRRVVVTAGPTREAIDPVRFLANRSTGAMGIALAEDAVRRGANVVLVLGPTHLSPLAITGLTVVRVESASDMHDATLAHIDGADAVIAAAAVSDFRPATTSTVKLKRRAPGAARLDLTENADILAAVGQHRAASSRGPRVVVGFAAETSDVAAHAREKLAAKGCDLVIGNRVGPDAGFGETSTEVVAVDRHGRLTPFGPASKIEVARWVLDAVDALFKGENA